MQIKSEMQLYESQKFHYQVAEYAFLIQNIFLFKNAPHIKRATAPQSLVKIHRTENGLLEKLDFSMPFCSKIQNIQLFLKLHQY